MFISIETERWDAVDSLLLHLSHRERQVRKGSKEHVVQAPVGGIYLTARRSETIGSTLSVPMELIFVVLRWS